MTLVQHLAKYREYHRDHRNVLTHAVGIPMIVFAVLVLLSRPVWATAWFTLTPAVVVTVLASVYYLKLDRRLGGAMALIIIVLAWVGLQLAQSGTNTWLGTGIGLFVLGWIFQLVGHKFEGRKPAFLDDLRSLLIGPIFVLAEGLFALGMLPELKREIESAR